MSAEWLTFDGSEVSRSEPTFHASHTRASGCAEPIRYLASPFSWCALTKSAAVRAVSPWGSTETTTIATCRCIAGDICAYALWRFEAISGHTSGQCAYRNVTNTALPRSAARLKVLPS